MFCWRANASVDYRHYLGGEKENVVPPHLIFLNYVVPADNWYVCMDGPSDVLPDMFIGRIPCSSSFILSQQVEKITGFTPASRTANQVVLVADNDESSFETLNEALVQYLPQGFGVWRVYLSQYESNAGQATSDLITYLNRGAMITNYVGHGSTTQWASEHLFDNNDVLSLSNGDGLTFVSAMTCQNGYSCLYNGYCLAEAFVSGVNRGAIGVLAPSGSGYVWEHTILDKALFSTIFQEGNGVMGSAVTQAKIAAYGKGVTADAVQTLTLFGDPATVLWEAPYSGTAYVGSIISLLLFSSSEKKERRE